MSLALFIAQGFGSGRLKPAPGTWGTLAGWLVFHWAGFATWGAWLLIVCAGAFALGVWACGQAGRELGAADHGSVVWDEVVAIWLVLTFVPNEFWSQLLAVLLFRFFDIAKPQPIRYFDAKWKTGFGVMWDDLLAAGYVLLVLALWQRLFG